MNIYLATNLRNLNPVKTALDLITNKLNIKTNQATYFNIEEQIIPQIVENIKNSDVIIADISFENSNIYYEVGIAHSLNKPVVLVSQTNNFNKFSLLSYRFYNYKIDRKGIENLSFRLEQILSDPLELDRLRPLKKKKDSFDYIEIKSNNQLKNILNLSGISKFYELEKWIYTLLSEIPGFEVQYNKQRNGKEYDFIVWNSNEHEDLIGLGNPIPIEVKASNLIENNLIHSLTSKAILQGFKSFILITTAELTDGNKNLIRNLKTHSDIAVLVIERNDLIKINSSIDLLKIIIKSFREYFIY